MSAEKKLEEHLERLTRRRNHLAKRVQESSSHLSFDEAELSTLDWVLKFVFDNQAMAVDHLERKQ